MTVGELKKLLENVNDSKTVIISIDEEFVDVTGVYVWDDVSDDPMDSPVELQVG